MASAISLIKQSIAYLYKISFGGNNQTIKLVNFYLSIQKRVLIISFHTFDKTIGNYFGIIFTIKCEHNYSCLIYSIYLHNFQYSEITFTSDYIYYITYFRLFIFYIVYKLLIYLNIVMNIKYRYKK
jgi:hypothetical protein